MSKIIKRSSLPSRRYSSARSSKLSTFKLPKQPVDQLNVKGRRILMRVDFNVPITDGKITNNHKILSTCPTIRYLLEREAKAVILISHLGHPDGFHNAALSLKPVAVELEAILGRSVIFQHDCVGPKVEMTCSMAYPGSIILLENLRFHFEEEGKGKNYLGNKIKADESTLANFRMSLSRLADIFVNDAFGALNKSTSSVTGIQLPVRASGFLVRKEMDCFAHLLESPQRPFVAIFGGSQIMDKVRIIDSLVDKVDEIILGVTVALNFLKVLNKMEIGSSSFYQAATDMIVELSEKAKAKNVRINLPQDFVTANVLGGDAKIGIATPATGIPKGLMGLDVGPKTSHDFSKIIECAKTILWIGPPGECEFDLFSGGTKSMMDAVVKVTQKGAVSIIAGKRTVSCAKKFNTFNKITHISTGGRASLDFLQGKMLPGYEALSPIHYYQR